MTRKMKDVWMVEDRTSAPGEPARSYWTKIGVAFEGEDGALELTLAAVPVTGKMVVKEAVPLAFPTKRTRGVA